MTRVFHRRNKRLAAGLVLALATHSAVAGEFNPLGDGSGTNNPDLLRDPTTGCENCDTFAPHEWDAPPFTFDWSLSLRGAYVNNGTSESFEALAVPSVTFQHDFLRGTYGFTGTAELSRSTTEEARLRSLQFGLAGDYEVNTDLTLSGSANLGIEQPSASAIGYPAGTLSASRAITGDAEVTASYDFGHLSAALRGNVARAVYGPTTLAGGIEQDNSSNNNWRVGGGLRVGYEVTPLLSVFVDGAASQQLYDTLAPGYAVKLDATDYAIRAGLASEWNTVLQAEASVGLGYRDFTYDAADSFTTQLYDASLTFRPDETVEIRGALATTVGAPGPNATGAARIEYAATGDVGYQVNPWVKLRASAGYRYAVFSDSAATETGYSLGSGADYLINENLTVTGDYGYSATVAASSTEEHRVTLGMTLSR